MKKIEIGTFSNGSFALIGIKTDKFLYGVVISTNFPHVVKKYSLKRVSIHKGWTNEVMYMRVRFRDYL